MRLVETPGLEVEGEVFALAWTTTPWTLPSNLALCVNPQMDYLKVEGTLFNKKISVLGLSFKSGSDDLRNSPSVKLVDILTSTGAIVTTHDPFVKDTTDIQTALKSPELVIIATNHSNFKEHLEIINKAKPSIIYDVWGMFKKGDFQNCKYVKFGESFT